MDPWIILVFGFGLCVGMIIGGEITARRALRDFPHFGIDWECVVRQQTRERQEMRRHAGGGQIPPKSPPSIPQTNPSDDFIDAALISLRDGMRYGVPELYPGEFNDAPENRAKKYREILKRAK